MCCLRCHVSLIFFLSSTVFLQTCLPPFPCSLFNHGGVSKDPSAWKSFPYTLIWGKHFEKIWATPCKWCFYSLYVSLAAYAPFLKILILMTRVRRNLANVFAEKVHFLFVICRLRNDPLRRCACSFPWKLPVHRLMVIQRHQSRLTVTLSVAE